MGTTKVTAPLRAQHTENDLAHGQVGENSCDSRIFGSSWRGDYIYSVR
jgi:hypothetical protein